MNNRTLLGLSLLALSISTGQAAMAADEKGEGFIEGSSLTILNRNLYFNRDFRKGQSSSSGNGYSEEWAHGVIGRFESGFTEGTIGVVCGRGRNPTLRLWPTIFSGKIDVFPGDRRSRLISSMTSVAPA